MASWPDERRVLGARTQRLDGPLKVSGRARYTSDQNPPGLLFGIFLRSPVGRARVARLDVDAARGLPGVRAVRTFTGPGRELRYHGDPVAAVAAETEAQARDAVRAIVFEYEALEPVTSEQQALADGAPQLHEQGNTRAEDPVDRGDVDAALRDAAATFEGVFHVNVQTHCCLEPHGGAAAWDGDNVTVWSSTQAVHGVRGSLAGGLKLPPGQVEVVCEHMGGGFGSKLGGPFEEQAAAQLAKDAGAPVRLMNEREGELTYAGCRESAGGRIRAACDAQGRLTAWDSDTYATSGAAGRAGLPLPLIYNFANRRQRHNTVYINAGARRAMRAPGHPPASFLTESVIDGLADQLGLDPLEMRLRNLGDRGLYAEQLRLGAERIGWSERQATGSQTGRFRRGFGCGVSAWGGRGHNSATRAAVHPDGSVEVWCGTQDIGTGTRTALAVVAAETLGLAPDAITVHIGRSSYPPSGGSGGSTTIGGVSSSMRVACEALRDKLAARLAQQAGAAAGSVRFGNGRVRVGERDLSWAQACGLLGAETLSAEGEQSGDLMNSGVSGAQFAEVEVDCETGKVKLNKIVACQDCGLIVNRLTAESQVYGGVIMGISFALFEERVLDPASGRMLNPNMEFYKLAGPSDIPEVEVHMQDQPERGVIGVGEPPTIPTAAAIANAVANALGVRVFELPLTPPRVLAALEAGRSQA